MALVPDEIVRQFQEQFGVKARPELYRAPGRVNLIGEHTDYNLGFVFPIAIEMACYVAIAPADHGELRIHARDLEESVSVPVNNLPEAQPRGDWSDYVIGVARELARAGVPVRAADLFIASEVPTGSGLSSSAALEIASAFALLGPNKMDDLEIAKAGQRAESQFVGVPCGIMDQYASVFGRKGDAIKIDCRSLEREYANLPDDVRIIAVNSMVKHELGTSAYRERVAECRAAVEAVQKTHPEVQSLRDVTPAIFEELENSLPDIPKRRARHVISDSQRVDHLATAARAHDLSAMGKLFWASHRSMKLDYEITCEEIDFLVDTADNIPGVYGSRMTGGGFGGCTVNLVAPDAVPGFEQEISQKYQERFNIKPAFYSCEPAEGASRIEI